MGANPLDGSIENLKFIGPKRAEALSACGLRTLRDLLYFFPRKYIDRTNLIPASKAKDYIIGGYEGEITMVGRVAKKQLSYGRTKILRIWLSQDNDQFLLSFFHGTKYFANKFLEGETYAVAGSPKLVSPGILQFTHPDYDRLSDEESQDFQNTGRIIPFYSLGQELRDKNISDIGIRKVITQALEEYSGSLSECLPENILNDYGLMREQETIRELHRPSTKERLKEAQRKMKFREIYYIEMLQALRRNSFRRGFKADPLSVRTELIKNLINSLDFKLTPGQIDALHDIRKDMGSDVPMMRLLQGDVGSGKTVVALIAMLISVDEGHQSVFMAPTEILALQHYQRIQGLLKGLGIEIRLLVGKTKASEKKKIEEDVASGHAKIIIGTHALIEKGVRFKNLGLAVIDEQHRFGVAQRMRLIEKGRSPHVLMMTATPIPRTLSMTVYADLDISIIPELPEGRLRIKTALRQANRMEAVLNFVISEAKEGRQTYIVYPVIEKSEKTDLKAATEAFKSLQSGPLKSLRLSLLHGRMTRTEKEIAMKDFLEKRSDVLVATTVIEVGIDVPSACTIIIQNAERFGLSQLHQLRGRVGRSGNQAYCILMTDNLSPTMNFNFDFLSRQEVERHKAGIRLGAMLNHSSGFDLSEIDLKLRGPGDFFSSKQSGFPELRFTDLREDMKIIDKMKEEAFALINLDPELRNEKSKVVKDCLQTFYRTELEYSYIA